MKNVANKYGIFIVAIFLGLFLVYFKIGQQFLNYKNLVIAILSLITLAYFTIKDFKNYFKILITLSFIPIIPHPLAGFHICVPLCLIGLFIKRKNKVNLNNNETTNLPFVASIVILFTILFTMFFNFKYGQFQYYGVWLYGIYFIVACIYTVPYYLSNEEIINAIWLGSSITISICSILYFLPSVKIPGAIFAENARFEILSQSYSRYSGLYGDYELYAEFCTIAVLISLYKILQPKQSQIKYRYSLLFVLSIIQVFLSGTRSSIFITLIFIVVLFGYMKKESSSQGRKQLFIILLLSILFITIGSLLSFLGKSGFIYRINSFIRDPQNTFINDRFELWHKFMLQISTELIKIPEYISFPINIYGAIPHSLILSLIFMFGMIPSLFVIYLIFSPMISLQLKVADQFIVKIILLAIFINELKIEAIRLPQYLIVIFTLSGAGYALQKKR